MKRTLIISALYFLFFPLILSAQDGQEISEQQNRVYYYLDCGSFCKPDSAMEYGKYWFISDTVYAAMPDSMENEVDKFKEELKIFSNHTTIGKNVVLRYEQSAQAAIDARKEKIEKMRGRHYEIIEIKYRPFSIGKNTLTQE